MAYVAFVPIDLSTYLPLSCPAILFCPILYHSRIIELNIAYSAFVPFVCLLIYFTLVLLSSLVYYYPRVNAAYLAFVPIDLSTYLLLFCPVILFSLTLCKSYGT